MQQGPEVTSEFGLGVVGRVPHKNARLNHLVSLLSIQRLPVVFSFLENTLKNDTCSLLYCK